MVAFVADRAFIDREWLQLERPGFALSTPSARPLVEDLFCHAFGQLA